MARDETKVELYERLIEPVMRQIHELCVKNRIPFASVFELSEKGARAGEVASQGFIPKESGSDLLREIVDRIKEASKSSGVPVREMH